ncbi:sensor histidine kinase [Ruminococcaceae bacterium OttesenSCG-928-A16]|nr:sensor histidine kinase [Ruminococcaceae bacterium OttesenSCG-928-A16]
MAGKTSLKFKIILICTVCTVLVGSLGNLYLYNYLTSIIAEKADNIETINMTAIEKKLAQSLEEFSALGYLCANDLEIATTMSYTTLDAPNRKQAALRASSQLQAYLDSHEIKAYINRLVAFNQYGLQVQAIARTSTSSNDPARITALPLFDDLSLLNNNQPTAKRQIIGLSSSIENGADCIALLSPVYNYSNSTYHGWIYAELNLKWINEALAPLAGGTYYFAADDDNYLPSNTTEPPPINLAAVQNGQTVRVDDLVYRVYTSPLEVTGISTIFLNTFTAYRLADVTPLASGGFPIIYTVLVVLVTSLIIALILAMLLSSIITKPLQQLTGRLRKISANDFSFDPKIEKGSDEIAEMGKVVNEMSASITHLLQETEEMYLQRQNVEIALLQSQINPHFLYNTLDSIRWMATIQKNPGIVNVTRSLSNLLRNIAKGVGDKIPLSEELGLLRDYVEIQSIRYVETFRYEELVPQTLQHYHIVKFTLQPLVENAIFHGIEPTGHFGVVTVDAHQEGDDLLITITDTGAGMTEEQIENLLAAPKNELPSSLSGIGVSNVDKRLRLQYGKQYGLFYQSVQGQYTTVTVRIPKEV